MICYAAPAEPAGDESSTAPITAPGALGARLGSR